MSNAKTEKDLTVAQIDVLRDALVSSLYCEGARARVARALARKGLVEVSEYTEERECHGPTGFARYAVKVVVVEATILGEKTMSGIDPEFMGL